MLGKNFLGKYAFICNSKKVGIVKLDELPVRTIFEDIGWTRDYKVFEVMEAKKTVVFHLDDHLERLNRSMLSTSLPFCCGKKKAPINTFLPYMNAGAEMYESMKDHFNVFVEKAILQVLEVNAFPASLVWLYFTGGSTNDSFNPISAPNLYIVNAPFIKPKLQKGKGLRLKTIPFCRHFPLIKNTNYFVAELSLPHITVAGYDDIAYCHNNDIFETSKANLFIVKSGIIMTPSKNILMGVTRNVVLELIHRAGLGVLEKERIERTEIEGADEVFITNTTKGVWPVVKVDEKSFKVGPITLKAKQIFENYRKAYYKERGV